MVIYRQLLPYYGEDPSAEDKNAGEVGEGARAQTKTALHQQTQQYCQLAERVF